MPTEATFVRAKYILWQGEVLEDAVLEVEGHKIVRCLRQTQDSTARRVEDRGHVAIVPGLINAHSHAFQRMIRGRTEYMDTSQGHDDFWSWRTRMYEAALSLSPESMYQIAHQVYEEMAHTGITSVGEFHYVHHQPDGRPYDDPNEMAHQVIQAARDVGLRIVLLRVIYNRAGFQQPANPRQRRFVEQDVDTSLKRVDDLRSRWSHDPCVSVGLAPHSIRAVPLPWFEAIDAYAQRHDMPIHIHACEQREEVSQSLSEYGRTPIQVLYDEGLLRSDLTLVHGTHLSMRDLDLCAKQRPHVCACPSTERNLGDGFLPALALLCRRVPICLGSDSHANVDLWDEMRLVEYHERLRYERRNVLADAYDEWFDPHPQPGVAPLLWPMGTSHGATSLKLDVGTLCTNSPADWVEVDLDHWSIRGASKQDLLTLLTLALKPGAVRRTMVHGKVCFK